ncbi:PTS sugar transporter subunit IIA [Streptococcus devriesei]|uniref:PTS sugar transporter subunit IIA n=1 Tax=Streptococcus devriesei TaxID=231233 RepID=UPI0004071256|nr:PTS sugar transporter subunit IIA [Streptococcus devriesei]
MSAELVKQVFVGKSFQKAEEVYHFLAEQIDASISQHLKQKLFLREKLANIQIDKQTVLPHLESSELRQSQLLILRLAEPIEDWSETIKNIRLVICLALKTNDERAVKDEIRHFMTNLADDAYVDKLLTDSKTTIEKNL